MPATSTGDLADKLKAEQVKADLSDPKFASELGISKALWQMYRTGERQIPHPPIFSGIARAHPELWQDVLIFLGFNVEVLSLIDTIPTKPHQTHQDKNLRGLSRLLVFCLMKLIFPGRVKAAQALKRKSKRGKK